MKAKLFFILLGVSILSCSKIEEPMYVCENISLDKVDLTYCVIDSKLNIFGKCNDKRDSLTMKVKQRIDNIQGKISKQNESNYCVIPDWETTKLNSLSAINLPQCYKKDGLKVVFSGEIRTTPELNEANCGDLFEVTKIEIVK